MSSTTLATGLSTLALCALGACVVHTGPPPAKSEPTAATPAPTAAPAATATAATPAPAELDADSDDPAPVADPLPKQEPVEDLPATMGTPERLIAGAAEGRPEGLKPGAPAGFWIWQNQAGRWKVRTTTAKALHEFKGRVTGENAPIGPMRPSRAEFKDQVQRSPDGGLVFRFHTKGHVDGFDFMVPGCARFDLKLDTGPTPLRVFVGKAGISPRTNHFVLCPK